eukprot:4500272-Pleurochrysis_carterae.AAC.2
MQCYGAWTYTKTEYTGHCHTDMQQSKQNRLLLAVHLLPCAGITLALSLGAMAGYEQSQSYLVRPAERKLRY